MSRPRRQGRTTRDADPSRRPAARLSRQTGLLACAIGLAVVPAAVRSQDQAPSPLQGQAQAPTQPPPSQPPSPPQSQPQQPQQPQNLAQPPQTRPLNLSINARLAATSNGGLDPSGMEQADVITSLRPELTAVHQGPNFSFDAKAAATFLDYANGTQPNKVLPDLHGSLKSTLIDQWLRVDASAYVRNVEADPFGVRADDLTGSNSRVESGFLVAPTLERQFGPQATLLAREEFSSTKDSTGDGTSLASTLTLLRFERKPTPLGMSAEVSRLVNNPSGDGTSYTLDTARLRGTLIVAEDIQVGAIAGEDRSDYLLSKHTDALWGGSISWTPGPRTHVGLELEHRYFGLSGSLSIAHRTPFMAIDIELGRQPVTSASSFGTLAQGTDIRNFLDAILTTRYPDPAVRSELVNGIVSSRGLTAQTAGAVNIIGDYPQLNTSAQASWTVFSPLNTLSFTAYTVVVRALGHGDDPLAGVAAEVADNRQRGANFQWQHRLSPTLSAGVLAGWTRYEGLGASVGQVSSEQDYRASVMEQLSGKSQLSIALQWNRFTTNAVGEHSFDATLALIGLTHFF